MRSLVTESEHTFRPGAKLSTQKPKFELAERWSGQDRWDAASVHADSATSVAGGYTGVR